MVVSDGLLGPSRSRRETALLVVSIIAATCACVSPARSRACNISARTPLRKSPSSSSVSSPRGGYGLCRRRAHSCISSSSSATDLGNSRSMPLPLCEDDRDSVVHTGQLDAYRTSTWARISHPRPLTPHRAWCGSQTCVPYRRRSYRVVRTIINSDVHKPANARETGRHGVSGSDKHSHTSRRRIARSRAERHRAADDADQGRTRQRTWPAGRTWSHRVVDHTGPHRVAWAAPHGHTQGRLGHTGPHRGNKDRRSYRLPEGRTQDTRTVSTSARAGSQHICEQPDSPTC